MNGYLLDTNVVSELRKGVRADAHVTAWFARRDRRELFLSAITLPSLTRLPGKVHQPTRRTPGMFSKCLSRVTTSRPCCSASAAIQMS